MNNKNFTNGSMELVYIMRLNGYTIFYRESNATFIAGYNTTYTNNNCTWAFGKYDFRTLESVITEIESL